MIRKFAVLIALLAVMTPATAYAAAPANTSIVDCLKAVHHSQGGMTLEEARICAPSATVVTKATGNGTFIVKTAKGYAILTSQPASRPSALAAATSASGGWRCYWRTYQLISAAILWTGATQCYIYRNATWTDTVHTDCHQYLPDGWCNWQNHWINSYGYLSEGVGFFDETAGWIFHGCDHLYLDQWWDGGWNGRWDGNC